MIPRSWWRMKKTQSSASGAVRLTVYCNKEVTFSLTKVHNVRRPSANENYAQVAVEGSGEAAKDVANEGLANIMPKGTDELEAAADTDPRRGP